MAVKKKAKKQLISIELGFGGLAGLTFACLCIFLWMYLFGVWTGQSLFQADDGLQTTKNISGFAKKVLRHATASPSGDKAKAGEGASDPDAEKEVSAEKSTAPEPDASFFAVQVAAFKEKQRAMNAVLQWRARDYESFYLLPEPPNGTFHRVFVGRFDSLAEANSLAAKLESAEQGKMFITLVSNDEERLP